MFSFFRKSKKDNDKKNKEHKENTLITCPEQGKEMCKNNSQTTIQKSEIALESDAKPLANYSSECTFQKNVSNETSVVDNSNEKNEANTSTNPDIIAAMCDNATVSYASMLKKPGAQEKRTSCVKPCGHGTTAISPRIPVMGAGRELPSPSASPVLEIRRQFRINGIEKLNKTVDEENKKEQDGAKLDESDEGNAITASMKLHINIPKENRLENGGTAADIETKNLINQEAKFQSQLNDLSKQLSIRDAEANKLKFQMEELQRDVFAKSAGMDRLESELNTAHKECDSIRQRIRILEEDLTNYRKRNNQLTEELSEKEETFNNYEKDTKLKINDLEKLIKDLREKIENLEAQLNQLKDEKVKLEQRHAELVAERDEEKKKVSEALEQAIKQKEEIETKWKNDFEKMRTINILKEQQLLDDFEWKLREVQQTCKKKLEDKDREVQERMEDAYKEAKNKMTEAEEIRHKLENLQTYELEVAELRGKTVDQEKAMKNLMEQHEQMKKAEEHLKEETKTLRRFIEMEKENLQHMQRIHHQEIADKERKLKQTLDEKRTEIAMYWEERLLHECGRLKTELEQIHSEEKWMAMESVRKVKDENFQKAQDEWEKRLRECLNEVAQLKTSLAEKDDYYHEQMVSQQTATDQDILELRRLMDKIDMMHHDKYEKLVSEHECEIERINEEHEKRLEEVDAYWQNQVSSLRATVESVREQMEKESQQKIEMLIQQHRNELDEQWSNLLNQKSEAIQLLEDEYVSKYKTLEEQFYTQQKSHSAREVELLKTIDSLKNELQSKESTIDDLQNNVDTLEGGVQVLNQEIFQHNEELTKSRRESDHKIRGLLETIAKVQEKHEKENEAYRLKFMNNQKQAQDTIDHLQKKCQCLTKLFEEVRQRYERRESRQEDLTTISDLRQVIAEQEKDLACINEEKRYFQMRLMALEKNLEDNASVDDEEFEDASTQPEKVQDPKLDIPLKNDLPPSSVMFSQQNGPICIPPTIPECDDCDE